MCCAIWYHLYNLKNVKKTHGGVLILVKLQAEACITYLWCKQVFKNRDKLFLDMHLTGRTDGAKAVSIFASTKEIFTKDGLPWGIIFIWVSTIQVQWSENASNCFDWFEKSSKLKGKLKEYFDFCNNEYQNVLKHLWVQWRAIEHFMGRIIKKFEVIFKWALVRQKKSRDHKKGLLIASCNLPCCFNSQSHLYLQALIYNCNEMNLVSTSYNQ